MEKLQKLYDLEINCGLNWFWDGGVQWHLGDEINGIKDTGIERSVAKAVDAVWRAAQEHYPKLVH